MQEVYYQINKARRIVRRLIAEMAYMGLVGTLAVPPFGILRRPLVAVLTPEMMSALALGISGDEPDVALNSMLGIRLGGMPACGILKYYELEALCRLFKERRESPLYSIVDVLAPHLGVLLSSLGLPEGDLLIAAYRVLEGEANQAEQARLFKQYDEWGLYAYVNVRHSGPRP